MEYKKKNDVGFLTLYEAYDYLTVGKNLKNPKFPIWVICSESHYSLLFQEINPRPDELNLFYYDGLANQEEIIRLTIKDYQVNEDSSQLKCQKVEQNENDLIPPLNLVIQTKWKNAIISWNDSEPIL